MKIKTLIINNARLLNLWSGFEYDDVDNNEFNRTLTGILFLDERTPWEKETSFGVSAKNIRKSFHFTINSRDVSDVLQRSTKDYDSTF